MSTLPQGGFGEHRPRGRRRAIILGAVVLVLLVWSAAVLSYGGGEAGGGAGKEGAGSPGNGALASQPASPESTDEQAVPDEPAYASEGPSGGAQGGGDNRFTAASTPAAATARRSEHEHAEGAAEEPATYDPLGTGASPSDLAPIDQERARFAAARFVSAAYGYSGEDKDAYNQGVGATVVWPDFYDSEGSEEIERYAAQVAKSGTRSAALLTRLQIEKTTTRSATGYAYFQTGTGYGKNGALTGRKVSYRQHVTLARSGATWAVRATGKIEETN